MLCFRSAAPKTDAAPLSCVAAFDANLHSTSTYARTCTQFIFICHAAMTNERTYSQKYIVLDWKRVSLLSERAPARK